LAGPGAISTVVLYTTKEHSLTGVIGLLISVVLAMGATFLVLRLAYQVNRFLGTTGLNVITRLMGMILTAIGVQFIINGIKGVLKSFALLPT